MRSSVWETGEHRGRSARRANPSRPDRLFGATASVLFIALFFIGYWRTGSFYWWTLAVTAVLVVCAVAAPSALSPLTRAWTAIWQTTSRILWLVGLTLMYALVIVPVGMIMRLMGRDPLTRRFDKRATTYWSPRAAADATEPPLSA